MSISFCTVFSVVEDLFQFFASQASSGKFKNTKWALCTLDTIAIHVFFHICSVFAKYLCERVFSFFFLQRVIEILREHARKVVEPTELPGISVTTHKTKGDTLAVWKKIFEQTFTQR